MAQDHNLLTGAQAVARICERAGVATVFAYPGTSELAICDSIASSPAMTLLSGRGDKECVFMAVGANLLGSRRAVAVLHGARGLTNAVGAIADARRNEVGVVCFVGLPSTRSARFLPPHGEAGLLQSIGNFAKWWHEVGPYSLEATARSEQAHGFAAAIQEAIARSWTRPYGPVIVGIPQDIAENEWIPAAVVDADAGSGERVLTKYQGDVVEQTRRAVELITESERPLILIDDYVLRYDRAKPVLAALAKVARAPVMQVRYRRGPMLFERLSSHEVPSFVGWWSPGTTRHERLMQTIDLLITLEDRNFYERVVGTLPRCRKLAITSSAELTLKNEYLNEGDCLIEGDVVDVLCRISAQLSGVPSALKGETWLVHLDGSSASENDKEWEIRRLRARIVTELGKALSSTASPVLVDDSQMFGGMISDEYDRLPLGLRIFGDHGGFVGSGIGYSTGLAIANPDVNVLSLLGDHGFVNGIQGLILAGEQRPNISYLVCNNGGSVSLNTQARALKLDRLTLDEDSHLRKPGSLSYAQLATKMGLSSQIVGIGLDEGTASLEDELSAFRHVLTDSLATTGPHLIELRLPRTEEFWAGIWHTHGFDEVPAGDRTS
jgi:acetolactate synthase I/II/III large subunit